MAKEVQEVQAAHTAKEMVGVEPFRVCVHGSDDTELRYTYDFQHI